MFEYDDVTGALVGADNQLALIERTVTPDGLTKTETLSIKNYQDGDFEHVFEMGFGYDSDRRLVAIEHPADHSPGTDTTRYTYIDFGAPDSVIDPLGNAYVFDYDDDKRLTTKTGIPTV